MSKLSKKAIKEYISSGGNVCPYCKQGTVEGGSRESDEDVITQLVSCNYCGKSWEDVYKLVNIFEFPE